MGEEALYRLRTTEPAAYLAPSSELSRLARGASGHLYSSLLPFCPSKPPLDQLLSDESFDAEQIWSQIDLLSKPLLPFLRRHLSRLDKESKLQSNFPGKAAKSTTGNTSKTKEDKEEEEDNSEELDLHDGGDEDEENEEDEDEEEYEEKDEETGEDEKGEEEGKDKRVDDKFLKIKELEKFLEDGEAKEYGLLTQKNKTDQDDQDNDNETDQDEEGDDDEEDAFDGQFDDVQRAPSLPSKAPRELKEPV